VITEPAKLFSRMPMGYDPAAVDAYIKLLLDDVESLRARLTESGDKAAALWKEVPVLMDTSPHAMHTMQHRMEEMLPRAVDEVYEMQAQAREEAEAAQRTQAAARAEAEGLIAAAEAEAKAMQAAARAEAEGLIAAAEAEAAAMQRKHEEQSADMAAQRKAVEAEYEETKTKLDAELATMRAETQSAIDKARKDAQQEREQLLAHAKQRADHYREQARRAVDEASQQRIKILQQLMGISRDLEGVLARLEPAYRERKNPPEASVVVPLGQQISRLPANY
jgi:cell division septum initiation protein DivIVA